MPHFIFLEYISITNMYNIFGIRSIQYILFFISVFKTHTFNKLININDLINKLASSKEESYYDILENVKQKINSTYNIFDFVFDNNNELL